MQGMMLNQLKHIQLKQQQQQKQIMNAGVPTTQGNPNNNFGHNINVNNGQDNNTPGNGMILYCLKGLIQIRV